MAQVVERGKIDATPDDVWLIVSDFVGFIRALIADMPDARVEGEGYGVGMLRKVSVGPEKVVERLEEFDAHRRRTSYSMPVPGPFPMTDYYATIQLYPLDDGGCELVWTGTFKPAGVTEDVAAAEVRNVYTTAIAFLQACFRQ